MTAGRIENVKQISEKVKEKILKVSDKTYLNATIRFYKKEYRQSRG